MIFVAYELNLPLNMEKPHYRSQRAGEWGLIWAHDSRPIYRALTYIAVPLLGPHQPRYIGLTLYIYIYIYDALVNRYGFSISVQPGIDCTTSQFLFMKCLKKKMFFKIFKSWQVCYWLAKWIIMLRFKDLRWPRVFRHSNVGLVMISQHWFM